MPADADERRSERAKRRERERKIYDDLRRQYSSVAESDRIYDPGRS